MPVSDPLPFIADHRLVQLVQKHPNASMDDKRRWLMPETFRWRGTDDRFQDAPTNLTDGWAWEDVPDRTAFLADETQRLRVITVNAGAGKTIAALQSQYLLQQVHDDHLCMLVNFSKLPNNAADIWGPEPEDSCLVRWFCETECSKDAPRREIARLISDKIRVGKFTLIVEAFDQTTKGKDTAELADVLRIFLELHPTVRCICTGRPHAIVDQCWEPLFQHDDWQFIQVAAFTPKQSEDFVGPERWKLCQKLEATELVVPRSLEAIRNIKPMEKLRVIRTASQLYWRSLVYTLQKARDTQNPDTFRSPDGSWEIRTRDALRLFSLLAFECNRQGFLDGVASGTAFKEFLVALWKRHQDFLQEEFGIHSKPALEATLTTLSRLNAAIDFAALDHEGITQVIFQNRTLQDFFAAIWMCTDASKKDRKWFSKHRFVRWKKDTHTHYQMWKLAVEMPNEAEGQMLPRSDIAWIKAVRVLYEPSTPKRPAVRSTEMIWRSWDTLEQLSDQPGSIGKAAKKVLDGFLGEYPSILAGARGVEAQRICEDFETWFVEIDHEAAGWKEGEVDDDGNPLPLVDHRYQIAKYTVTNELYLSFEVDLSDRYAAYGKPVHGDKKEGDYFDRSRAPVVAIDWYDAWCAAKWLGGKLPTDLPPYDMEWEYACRAGQRTRCSVGNGRELTADDARFGMSFNELPIEVDAFSVGNPWGLYQMHGNVWEVCENWYDASESSRCLRGGSFFDQVVRSSRRGGIQPQGADRVRGLRVSRVATK